MTKSGIIRAPQPAWPALLSLAVALGCGLVLFVVDPSHSAIYPQCLFHRWTGWNCPGCGSLRAMHQLLHGHVLLALRCNALLMVSLPLVGFYAARWIRRRRAGLPMVFPAIQARWVYIFAGVLVIFTLVRNIPMAPFIYLSPP